jgi:hypothetical protein
VCADAIFGLQPQKRRVLRPGVIVLFLVTFGCGRSSAPAPNPQQTQAPAVPVAVRDVPAWESLGTVVLEPFDSIYTLDEIPEVVSDDRLLDEDHGYRTFVIQGEIRNLARICQNTSNQSVGDTTVLLKIRESLISLADEIKQDGKPDDELDHVALNARVREIRKSLRELKTHKTLREASMDVDAFGR